jgi:vesicle transport protein SEC22
MQAEHYNTIKQELSDVRVVIRKNLDDLLTRGERLDVMNQYSAQLKHQSGNYYKKTVRMNRMRVLKTYGPPIVIILFILAFLYWKYF